MASVAVAASSLPAAGFQVEALFQLATDLPAAILAKMLGIHISVVVARQRASSGDWTSYEYSDIAWADDLAIGELIRTRAWGPITERRFVTTTGLEVEIGIGHLDWASINPIDPGRQRVVTDGARILHDPAGVLANLLRACQNQSPSAPTSPTTPISPPTYTTLRDRERVLAAADLDDWAKTEALPSTGGHPSGQGPDPPGQAALGRTHRRGTGRDRAGHRCGPAHPSTRLVGHAARPGTPPDLRLERA